jgi:hypothetical protein
MNSHEHNSVDERPLLPLSEPTKVTAAYMLQRIGEFLNSDAQGALSDEQLEAWKGDQPDTKVSAKAATSDAQAPAEAPPQPARPAVSNRHRRFKGGATTPRGPDLILQGECLEPVSPNARHFGSGHCNKQPESPAEPEPQRPHHKRHRFSLRHEPWPAQLPPALAPSVP